MRDDTDHSWMSLNCLTGVSGLGPRNGEAPGIIQSTQNVTDLDTWRLFGTRQMLLEKIQWAVQQGQARLKILEESSRVPHM